MSASDVPHSSSDHSPVGLVCDKLEAELHKKVCSTVQKAVNDTVCASLKRGIHAAVAKSAASGAANGTHGTPNTLAFDACAYLEETTSNAVCASLKQVTADTVCKALKEAISTSLHNAGRWDEDMPFHVTPEALNISCEDILGNAACAALKQVFTDTVCKALNKTIDSAIASVVQTSKEKGLPSLNEVMQGYASIADAEQLRLGSDGTWYIPEPTNVEELCNTVKQRMTSEICSRLQQLATSVLCARLKKVIREEIRQHPERCEQCKNVGRTATRTAARSVLTYKVGMMVVAIIAVAAVAVTAAAPGSPYQQNVSQLLPFIPPIGGSSDHVDGGGSNGGSGSGSDGGSSSNTTTSAANVTHPPTITLNAPTEVTQGDSFTLTTTVKEVDGSPRVGTLVTFTANGGNIGSNLTDASGVASLSPKAGTANTITFTAKVNEGGTTYTSNTVTVTPSPKRPLTIKLGGPAYASVNASFVLTATVKQANGNPYADAPVTFIANGVRIDTKATYADGVASVSYTLTDSNVTVIHCTAQVDDAGTIRSDAISVKVYEVA